MPAGLPELHSGGTGTVGARESSHTAAGTVMTRTTLRMRQCGRCQARAHRMASAGFAFDHSSQTHRQRVQPSAVDPCAARIPVAWLSS